MPMQIDRAQLKYDAKASMRDRKPSVYLVALVFLLIGYVLDALITRLMYPNVTYQELLYMDYEQLATRLLEYQPGFIAELLSLAIQIMELMLTVGFMFFCLNVARGLASGFGDLFAAFEYFLRVLWLSILMYIFIFLWSLLLIVPGIIAAYRYSMALYILMDDPDKSALECIRESKAMTAGYKGQLFVLDLSFLGWYLLSAIPFVSVYTLPYIETTRANFYRAISGRADAPQHIDYTV